MPTAETWQELRVLSRLKKASEKSRLLHIVRPVLIHVKGDGKTMCTCGCNSVDARVSRKVTHIEMLLDTYKGTRRFKTKSNAAWFEARTTENTTERIYIPLRCYEKQWRIIADVRACARRGKWRKVTALFGGNRSGKTTIAMEILLDLVLIAGGRGASFWVVSPTREMTQIAVNRLVRGDVDGRKVVPLFPERMVRHYPKSDKSDKQYIQILDGTRIYLHHAHGNGDNLKGRPAKAIFVDEGCAIRDIGNWHVMLNRTMGTKGALFVSTTPCAGHWLKEEVHTPGLPLAKAANDTDIISESLSCFDNPWIPEGEVERTIAALNDAKLIRRDIYGEWIPRGNVLWHYWDTDKHIEPGKWQTCEELGYRNITPEVARDFFDEHEGTLKVVGGLDFNVHPMSLIDIQIGVWPGHDATDPQNWHVFVPREVVEDGGTHSFCATLNDGEAATLLGLPASHYRGFPIAADSTGSQDNPPSGHGVSGLSASLAAHMKGEGFDIFACNLSDRGRPSNPAQLERLQLVHELMFNSKLHVHPSRCKKLIHAFETQECLPDGRIDKIAGTKTDKISGPSDALTYICWAMLSEHLPSFTQRPEWLTGQTKAA